MRTLIFTAAAALLALAAPTVASAQTGYAGVVYSNADEDGADSVDAWGVQGAAYFAGSGSLGFEVDGSVVNADSDPDDVTSYGLTGHVLSRNDQYMFGGFIGLADSDADDSDTVWSIGGEGAKYYDNWTLDGAIGYASSDSGDGYGVNVGASLFTSDNLRIDGKLGWANVSPDGADDFDVTDIGVGVEYQFASVPISLGASYDHLDSDGPDVDVLGVTVRYNWGGSLKDRDRSGASQADRINFGSLL